MDICKVSLIESVPKTLHIAFRKKTRMVTNNLFEIYKLALESNKKISFIDATLGGPMAVSCSLMVIMAGVNE